MKKQLLTLILFVTSLNLISQTINFDEPFGTQSWNEDGYSWSWDNTGWDNIRTYNPHTGSGHGMSAQGYHSKLSTSSEINIDGVWIKTDFASNFSHLNLKGFDNAGNLIYTQALNPMDYQQYAYATLNWDNVKSFAVDYDGVPRQKTLNFDEPFGTQSWNEDGYSWSWDNTGWDNIRTYNPHTGSGHGMSAQGYHSKLSTSSEINIDGVWIKTDFASNFSHLNLKGFDNAGNLIYTQALNPMDYQQYAYATLNWDNVKSFAVDYDGVPRQKTLNFDEPFGTQSWNEDGYSWSWDNTGWDNIRTYNPHTGSGHGMSAQGYHSKLSTSSEINIDGVWIKTDFASNFSHLNLKGFDNAGNLIYTQALNPMDYQQYAYATLNWDNVKSFAVDYDGVPRQKTLNFDEPFGTQSWNEDGYSWSWDNTGWDNIRTYNPHTGSGHGMSAQGYHSKLSTSSEINIDGVWIKTDFASNFSHLNLKGFDNAGNLIYTQALNPMDYQQYAYATLNWDNVKSFAVDYDGVPRQKTLNFDEPFGTQSWNEDGYSWSWDNTGWDNIRTYNPHTGSGHGMSAQGYHSKLSTSSEINIDGVWIKTDFASNFSHLNLKGFDNAGNLIYTQALNPMDYQQYAYATLNWDNVKSFAVDYDGIDPNIPVELYYDDLVYSSSQDLEIVELYYDDLVYSSSQDIEIVELYYDDLVYSSSQDLEIVELYYDDLVYSSSQDLEIVELYYDDLDYSISTLGLNDINTKTKIGIFPNPSKDFIQITGLIKIEKYKIYNTIGAEMKKGIISDNKKIEIKNFSNGLYFIKFDNGYTLKFIKK